MKIVNCELKISKGFTLIEVILYTAIFAIVGGLVTGILLTVTQVQQRESASAEVTGQLNFVMQTVQRLVRESSNIEIEAGMATSTLKLRMQDSAKDPTCISLVDDVIKLAEGPDGVNPNNCTTDTSDLTNDRVTVNTLNFKKFTQYPGHDTVSIDLTMTYNSTNPKSQVQRTLSSAIARVSAATFDSNLLPGSASFEIGQSGSPWQNLYLSGVLNLGTAVSDPAGQNGSIYYNTASSTFRGYKDGAWSDLGAAVLWNSSGDDIYNTNSGNVGIGMTGPGEKFVISRDVDPSTDQAVLLIDNPSSASWQQGESSSRLYFGKQNDITGYIGNIHTRSGGDHSYEDAGLVFATLPGCAAEDCTEADLVERMIITHDGKIGIGTSTPAYTLDVQGSIHASSSISADGSITGGGGRATIYQENTYCGGGATFGTTCSTLACGSDGKGYTLYYTCAGACTGYSPSSCGTTFRGYLH